MTFALRKIPTCPVSGQSPIEELINSLIHAVGFVAFIAGTSVMITMASLWATPWHIVSVSIFGASLILLYGTSTWYHWVSRLRTKKMMQVLDHAAIFLLIAGTYTPFTLVPLRGGWGWSLFGVVWGGAVAGIIFKIFFTGRWEFLSTVFYVALGWMVVIAIVPLYDVMPGWGLFWLVMGGVAYTLGAVFYIWDRKVPFFHSLFHVFVLLGSAFHFWSVIRYVMAMP